MPYRYVKRERASHYFYVWNHGKDGKSLFRTEEDYRHLVQRLSVLGTATGCSVIAYSLLRDQYHLVLEETVEGGIAKFMHKLNVAYAMYFNSKYEQTGKLFAGPYHDRQLDDEEQVVLVAAMLHNAPRGLDIHPSDYLWSSYRAYTKSQSDWLHKQPMAIFFAKEDVAKAVEVFTRTVPSAQAPFLPEKAH